MKLPETPYLPEDMKPLVRQLDSLWRQTATQVNQISEGQLVGTYNAATAAPTGGAYAQGDFIRNSAPTELGVVSSKYLIYGWACVAAGTPGTWRECRFLTGN